MPRIIIVELPHLGEYDDYPAGWDDFAFELLAAATGLIGVGKVPQDGSPEALEDSLAFNACTIRLEDDVKYKVGDPDPTPDGLGANGPSGYCAAETDSKHSKYGSHVTYGCTWPDGHEGNHVAGDGDTILAVWA